MAGLGLSSLDLGLGSRGASGPAIVLSATSIAEDAASSSTVGTLSVVNHPSGSSGWTFAETADPDNKFAVSGADLNTSAALDYDTATSHSVTITASKAAQTDIVRVFTISVTNVLEVTLNALALDGLSFTEDAADSGSITGKTSGSTVTLDGSLPTGLTLDLTGMTWAWDGTGTLSDGNFTLRETHADGSNSPRDSVQAWEIVEVPVDPDLDETLYAPSFTLVSAQDEYPPEFDIEIDAAIPVEVCSIRLQGGDEDFAILTIDQEISPIGSGALDFTDLADITDGENFFRCRIEDGSTHGPWSIVRKHGDTTAPTLSGDASISETEGVVNPTGTVTADETSTWELGGADAGFVSIDTGPSLTADWTINATTDYDLGKRSYVFTVIATDLADNDSDPFEITYTVLNDAGEDPDPQWSPRAEDKSSSVTLSNGNLTADVAENAGIGLVKCLIGRAYGATSAFEVEVEYNSTNAYIGFCYAAAPTNQQPGYDNNHGIILHAALGGWEIYVGTALVAFNYGGGGADGDVLRAERVGSTVVFKRNGVTLGTSYTLPTGTGDVFAFYGAGNLAGSGTADFTGY